MSLIAVSAMIIAGCSDSSGSAKRDIGEPTDRAPPQLDARPGSDTEDSPSEDTSEVGHPDAPEPVPDADDVSSPEDTALQDTVTDTEDTTTDTSSPTDASDTHPPEDTGESDVAYDPGQIQRDADIMDASNPDVRLDTEEFRDTDDTSKDRFRCPEASEFRGVCSLALSCCENETLGERCQYGNPCEIPEVLEDDPEWVCEPC